MKKFILVFSLGCIFTILSYGQNVQSVHVNKPGTLISHFTEKEAGDIKSLTLTGKINAVDFRYLRDDFSSLEVLDISNADIRTYTGGKGTHPDNFYVYPANCIPAYAFCKLENGRFQGKSTLRKIILSAKTRNIEDAAFKNCDNLSICVIRKKTPPNLLTGAMNDSVTSVFVPLGSSDTYKSKKEWSPFAILEGDPVIVELQIGKLESLENKLHDLGVDADKVNCLVIEGKLDYNDFSFIKNNMPNLVNIDIFNTDVSLIPDFTFTQKKNLLKINLPQGLTTIGERVFSNCGRLSGDLYLPQGVKTIGYGAFMGCDKLTSVIVTGNLESVGDKLFGDKDKLVYQ